MWPSPAPGRRRHRAPVGILNRQDGIALVLTLLVVTLLTAMIIDFDYRTRLDVRAAAGFRDAARANFLAQGAVDAARAVLMEDVRTSSSYTYAEDPQQLWGTPITGYPVADGTISVKIEDEGGKLDLNKLVGDTGEADEDWVVVYRRLLEGLLDPNQVNIDVLVDSLVDWIDPNPDERSADGAESPHYERLDPPYACADGPLQTIDQLALVQGYTPEIVERLRPFVTALWNGHGGNRDGRPKDGKININDAKRELLQALINEKPNTGGVAENIEGDRPIESTEASSLERVNGLDTGLSQVLFKYTDVFSDYFSIEATGTVGETSRSIRVTVQRFGNQAKVISWRSE
jgi:general secretion pathway protein K